jgi:hypothetical protein
MSMMGKYFRRNLAVLRSCLPTAESWPGSAAALHQDEYSEGEDCDREGKEADDEALPWDGILALALG